MNPAKCDDYSYIDFLIATPHTYTCMEAACAQPDPANPPAHDALTRLLYRLEPSSGQLREEVKPHVQLKRGYWSWMTLRWISPTLEKWDG